MREGWGEDESAGELRFWFYGELNNWFKLEKIAMIELWKMGYLLYYKGGFGLRKVHLILKNLVTDLNLNLYWFF